MFTKATSKNISVNIFGEGTHISGELTGENIRLDGSFIGKADIVGKSTIGKSGSYEGSLKSGEAEISGLFDGTICVSGLLVVKSTAKIKGTISASQLSVEKGAVIEGKFEPVLCP
jgi:cytoskeletal protein CcmA (bactofilin family)